MTKHISRKMAVDCLLHRIPGYVNCGLCGVGLRPGDNIEFDHIHAWIHGGPHAYQNLRPVHAHCHKAKTKYDIQANAKVKRIIKKLAGITKPKKAIPSRPFQKAKKRGAK